MKFLRFDTWLIVGVLISGQAGFGDDGRGAFSLDSRLRYEQAEVDGLGDAENLSLRVRPGYLSPEFGGLQVMAEGEFTFVADKGAYNAGGVHGDADAAVIADPENAQLEQLWLSYAGRDTAVKIGRQVIALDNHRWVGHVGWRQNRQTFDAATLKNTSIENFALYYGYIANTVRIFGDQAPSSGGNAEEFGSDSHLINVAYDGGDLGKVTVYGYFVDLEDAPGKITGSDTIGVSYKGTCTSIEHLPLGLYLEYANQRDAGDNVQDYEADYFHAVADAKFSGVSLTLGYELLGSDSVGVGEEGLPAYASVKAPLATLHKFNGFADVFLVTPDRGLEDMYVKLGYTVDLGKSVGPLTAAIWYHDFSTDKGSDGLGHEVDAHLVKPIKIEGLPGTLTALVKYANYQAPSSATDVERFSGELNYSVTF